MEYRFDFVDGNEYFCILVHSYESGAESIQFYRALGKTDLKGRYIRDIDYRFRQLEQDAIQISWRTIISLI